MTSDNTTMHQIRAEVGELRSELAELQGEVAAIDAALNRVQQQIDRLDDRLGETLAQALKRFDDKLDTVIGLKDRLHDITGRIALVETEVKQKQSWRDRAAWLYAGAMTAVTATLVAMRVLGKL